MIAVISRVLTIALAVYSYFQITTAAPQNFAGAPPGMAARLLFIIQLFVTLIFFIIPFFPESIHFGSRRLADYAPKQLQRITPLVKDMIGLMGLLMTLYFAVNVHLFLGQASSRSPREAARAIVSLEPWLVGALLVGEAALTFYYLRRFDSVSDSVTDSDETDMTDITNSSGPIG